MMIHAFVVSAIDIWVFYISIKIPKCNVEYIHVLLKINKMCTICYLDTLHQILLCDKKTTTTTTTSNTAHN